MSGLVKMILSAYSDGEYTKPVPGGEYKVMMNPETINFNRSINYIENDAIGSNSPSPKYNCADGGDLSFDLIIDCTGVVDKTRVILPLEIESLQSVVYNYNGKIHRSNYVTVQWGISMIFKGVLKSFDIVYNYFNSVGLPLRAKISLKFTSYADGLIKELEKNNASPDMTHLINVTQGDTLPNLSYGTYNDSSYYVQLAKFNGLNKFRRLSCEKTLTFPPIVAEK